MAIEKANSQTCGVVCLVNETEFKVPTNTVPKKRKLKVLDEDDYTQDLENIIARDFFPDVPKLQAQAEYLDALEKNDVVRLREIHSKYASTSRPGTSSSAFNSPSTFETPVRKSVNDPTGLDEKSSQLSNSDQENGKVTKAASKNLSLDAYLSRTTSEDNASFATIMEEADQQHRAKHAWLYEREELAKAKHKDILALPNIAQQAIQDNPPLEIDTWTYNNRNSLMYVPDGVAPSERELNEMKSKQREIVHSSTRFQKSPFNELANRQAISDAAQIQARLKEGKIGVDGKELLPSDSPKVNGYGFVVTPSPAPGVSESPLMTWGEIEGTPFLLDGGSSTPGNNTPGPTFHIAAVPARDKLALELAEKARQRHRTNKEDALKAVQENLASPLRLRSRCTPERLGTMSSAAQRLASSRLGIRMGTDKALMASYTPTRQATPSGSTTPRVTPVVTRQTKSPAVTPKLPKSTPEVEHVSLTDNLLHIPKRPRAADFFTPTRLLS